MKKQSYYMVIPASVWDSDLDQKSILLYGHISTLASKNGYAHALDSYFEKVLGISKRTVQRKLKELEDKDVIRRTVIYHEDKKTVKERRIYLTPACDTHDTRPIDMGDTGAIDTSGIDNNTRDNNTSNNNIDEVLGKIFFKIVEMYPKNRVGNRQHGLKKFKDLDIEQAKLAIKNLNRYLTVANGYVKSLQNYITEECFTEEWLQAEEKNKTKKDNTKTNKSVGTKTFKGTYEDF